MSDQCAQPPTGPSRCQINVHSPTLALADVRSICTMCSAPRYVHSSGCQINVLSPRCQINVHSSGCQINVLSPRCQINVHSPRCQINVQRPTLAIADVRSAQPQMSDQCAQPQMSDQCAQPQMSDQCAQPQMSDQCEQPHTGRSRCQINLHSPTLAVADVRSMCTAPHWP